MSVNRPALNHVQSLCQEVITLANVCKMEMSDGWTHTDADGNTVRQEWTTHPGSLKSGELRRRTMDLTRALAELRRS